MSATEATSIEPAPTIEPAWEPKPTIGVWGWLLCLVVAAIASAWSASLGLDWDLYVNYNPALRNLAGQWPFRDYDLPFGAIPSLLLTPWFLLPVTGGMAFLLATAAMNVVATAIVAALTIRRTRDRTAAVVAGLYTALWFSPPTGGYYHDHIAFLFVLGAVSLYLSDRGTWLRLPGIGFLLTLAFFSKQSVGVFGLAAIAAADLLVFSPSHSLLRKFDWLRLALWGLVFTAAAVGMIALFTDLEAWWVYGVVVPIDFVRGVGGVGDKSSVFIFESLIRPLRLNPWQAVLAPLLGLKGLLVVVGVVYWGYSLILRDYVLSGFSEKVRSRSAGAIVLSLAAISIFDGASDMSATAASVGIGLLAGAAVVGAWRRPRAGCPSHIELILVLALVNAFCTCNIARSQMVHAWGLGGVVGGVVAGVRGRARRTARVLGGLSILAASPAILEHRFQWTPEPQLHAYIQRADLHISDVGDLWPIRKVWFHDNIVDDTATQLRLDGPEVDELLRFLRANPGRKAYIDDKAFFLPAILREPDWQASVVFRDGICIPVDPNRRVAWQKRYIESVEHHGVDYIIVTLNTGLHDLRTGPANAEPSLPLLMEYIRKEFQQVYSSPHFRVFEKKRSTGRP